MKDRITIWFEKKFYKIYTTLDFIPIGCFFGCLENNDLRYLFKLKNYEVLPNILYKPTAIWTRLYYEFIEQSGGFSMFAYTSDFRQIITQKELYSKLKHAAFLLSIKEDKELINIIKQCGYKFDYTDEDEYCNCIIDLKRQLDGLEKTIEKKYSEFVKRYKQNNKKVDIYEIINAFEQYKGRKIDIWTSTMKEFMTIQKGYKQWIKQYQNGR